MHTKRCILIYCRLLFRCPPRGKHEDELNGTFIVSSGEKQMFLKNESSLMNGSGSALVITFGCICLFLLLAVVSYFLTFI